VKGIEGSIPVLVKSANWIDTAEEIDDLFLGDAEVHSYIYYVILMFTLKSEQLLDLW
jgi:hypothetical protein